MYISERFWEDRSSHPATLARHLMKLLEIFDVSLESLPQLEHIEVNFEIFVMEQEPVRHKFEMIYRRDVEALVLTSSSGELSWPSTIGQEFYLNRDAL